MLFHGTESCNVGSIFTRNFDPSANPKKRRKTAVHGPGVYFSERLPTALSYTSSETVILSRVLLGKVLAQDKGLSRNYGLARNQGEQEANFDSKRIGQDIVVASGPNQILPFCVISCKKK